MLIFVTAQTAYKTIYFKNTKLNDHDDHGMCKTAANASDDENQNWAEDKCQTTTNECQGE